MKPDDHLDYYEIDAEVIRIARDPRRFTFLRDCKPDAKIVLGDARLTIADATDARYNVIVVDAFSSDSIPVHLLTREALRIYLSRLKPGGIIVLDNADSFPEPISLEGYFRKPTTNGVWRTDIYKRVT